MLLADLRRLAGPCNFGQFVTRVLHDRFIAGINDEHIQEKVLSVPDGNLTLDRAFRQIAEFHKAACRNVKEMLISPGDQAPSAKVQNESKFQGRTQFQGKEKSGRHQDGRPVKGCFRCGSADHDPRECGFRNKNWFHCGRKGHAKVKCFHVGWKSKVKNTGEDDSDDEVHTEMYSIRGGEKSVNWKFKVNQWSSRLTQGPLTLSWAMIQ